MEITVKPKADRILRCPHVAHADIAFAQTIEGDYRLVADATLKDGRSFCATTTVDPETLLGPSGEVVARLKALVEMVSDDLVAGIEAVVEGK